MLTSTQDEIFMKRTEYLLMGFLEHFDHFVERKTTSCNSAATCTPIRLGTQKKYSINYQKRKSGHGVPI